MTNGRLGLPTERIGQSFQDYLIIFHRLAGRGMADHLDPLFARYPRVTAQDGPINRGGGRGIFQAGHFKAWWLWRANRVGRLQADAEIEEYFNTDASPIIYSLTLYGVTASAPLAITREISLRPIADLPFSQAQDFALSIDPLVPNQFTPYVPTAALVAEGVVHRDEEPNYGVDSDWWARQGEMHQLALLMNLFPGVCCMSAFQQTSSPDHIPPGVFAGDGHGGTSHDVLVRAHTPSPIPADHDLQDLLLAFGALPPEDGNRLRMALYRFAQSKARSDPNSAVLDLGIALETAMLPGIGQNVSRNFRKRGAWIMDRDPPPGEGSWEEEFRRLYQQRSKVAHEGRFEGSVEEFARPAPARQRREALAEAVFRRIIKRHVVDWPEPVGR